ncbi:MAG: 4-hydroxythreonine-4-phosphate dehydrogenase PdxA [Gammaproteobacteria bacterium]|nr:4-hydroxythreonine-4-phosphate dehydrogenase PdxA [Gammaproteobacteria bacterium]
MTPRIAITSGEPAGIGPDLCVALADSGFDAELVLIGDPDLLERRARELGQSFQVQEYRQEDTPVAGKISVAGIALERPVQTGSLDTANAGYVLRTLDRAITGCQSGEFQAMVTAPVHKGIINDAGIAFTGHTEYLAAMTGAQQVVMMLAAPGLRVALATTHLPLKEVSSALSREGLEAVIRCMQRELQTRFSIQDPHILVAGLNPHAGENGHLGREEIDVITPVIEQLKNEGMQLSGPLPADTLFTPPWLSQADAVLAMYHDQGLPVLKHLGFGQSVNITLGLPIVRTSVDHGTALDKAGTGEADAGSLHAAIRCALDMST